MKAKISFFTSENKNFIKESQVKYGNKVEFQENDGITVDLEEDVEKAKYYEVLHLAHTRMNHEPFIKLVIESKKTLLLVLD